MAPPLIRAGSNESININFDIIGDSHEYLCYRIIHCNADWQPSSLSESEYLQGFNEVRIDDYEYSYNTFTHYVNYNILIPESTCLRSGNYLVQFYPEGEPEDVILQVRFMVSEDNAKVRGSISGRTDKGINDKYQQLDIDVDLPSNIAIDFPDNIEVYVVQNNRPETTKKLKNPLKFTPGKFEYRHSPELIFPAGNEYRRFETVRADYPGLGVDSVRFVDNIWNAWLSVDEARDEKNYRYDETQKGRFKIDEYNSNDPDLSADYVYVNFTLSVPEMGDASVYVDGDFTLHRFDDFNRMTYDRKEGAYKARIKLKQGSYNYQYVVIPEEGSQKKSIEGDKYETLNEYLVTVYLRKPGERADRLIGAQTVTY